MVSLQNQGTKTVINDHMNLMAVLKGIAVSYAVSLPVFILFSIVLTYVNFPEKMIFPVVVVTTVISILVAGSTATRNIRNKGWLNGAVVGFVYMLILYVSSSMVFKNFNIGKNTATMILTGILAGATGGIIGINLKRHSFVKARKNRIIK